MRIAKSVARQNFADVVGLAGRGGERVKITQHGRTLAVLIPKRDLKTLEACEDDTKGVAASADTARSTSGSRSAKPRRARRKP